VSKRPVVRDRKTALWGGVAAIVVGSLLLHDAYERRGKSRPWAIKWLPGA
jgi:hypothetical protein